MIHALIPLVPLLLAACGADAEPLAEVLYAASAPRVREPTFSPAAGTYTGAQSVTVRTTSTGAAIYCTQDGTTPRRVASLRYSAPLSVASSQTVRCIAATLDGREKSRIGAAAYVINSASPPAVASGAACDGSTAYAPGSEPLRSNGRPIHYYCNCTGTPGCPGTGTDKADCTNPNAPCQSLSAALAKFATMGAGETVALCRGGEWSTGAGAYTNNPNCRAGSTGWPPSANNADTCDLRDYGSPSLPRPKVNADKLIAFQGTSQGHRVWNIQLWRAPQPSYGNEGILVYEQAQYNDFCNLRVEGGALGVHISGQTNNYNSIRNSQFYGVAQDAILSESSNLTIDSNYIENCGTTGAWGAGSVHAIYVAAYGSTPAANLQLTNNEIVAGATCYGPQIVLHGQHSSPRVENNLVRNPSGATDPNCYGIQLSKSDNVVNCITNASVRRNRVVNMPGTAMEVTLCQDCAVTDNIIQSGTLYVGPSVTVSGGSACTNTRTTVQNNDIYSGSINFGSQGDGYIIENNAIWRTSGACLSSVPPALRNAYNVCRNDGSAATLLWTNPTGGDFSPVASGPLDNAGDPAHYSATAIGSATWSATDAGVTRAPPIDVGAMTNSGMIYATASGGRVWTLPADPTVRDSNNWSFPAATYYSVTSLGNGIYHTQGSTNPSYLGQVRQEARAGTGAWFRNVEVTGYFRWTSLIATPGQVAHWELTVRGERQTTGGTVAKSTINNGNLPPAGTVTWPWWDSFVSTDQVLNSAMGTSYHANVYVYGSQTSGTATPGTGAARVHFEKELSHADGYNLHARANDANAQDITTAGWPAAIPANQWFGMKFVCRNIGSTAVKLELWIDYTASGSWSKVAEYTETDSNPWIARTVTMDGTNVAPYNYQSGNDGAGNYSGTPPTKVTWAGPYVVFRSDGVAIDFRDLSIREIDPL